jgi:hypothetical protein
MFDHISQKRSNKKRSGQTILRQNLADFGQKGLNINKIISLLLSSLFLGKCPRNIFIFPLTQTKIVFFLSPNFFKKGKLLGGPNFFLQRLNFASGLAEKFCQELATLEPCK